MAGASVLLSSIEGMAAAQRRPIRIGVIGCGSVSSQYLPHLSKSPHVELVSVCDIICARAQKRAAEYRVPHHYPHIDQMLAGAPFDLFVDLTDMQEHGRLNRQALLADRCLEREAHGQHLQGRQGSAGSGRQPQAWQAVRALCMWSSHGS
jgi:Oxidoreductase family, NAD-binding Rossmann fold